MDYVIKKSYLGLALQEVLEELGIEHMSTHFAEELKVSFNKNFH